MLETGSRDLAQAGWFFYHPRPVSVSHFRCWVKLARIIRNPAFGLSLAAFSQARGLKAIGLLFCVSWQAGCASHLWPGGDTPLPLQANANQESAPLAAPEGGPMTEIVEQLPSRSLDEPAGLDEDLEMFRQKYPERYQLLQQQMAAIQVPQGTSDGGQSPPLAQEMTAASDRQLPNARLAERPPRSGDSRSIVPANQQLPPSSFASADRVMALVNSTQPRIAPIELTPAPRPSPPPAVPGPSPVGPSQNEVVRHAAGAEVDEESDSNATVVEEDELDWQEQLARVISKLESEAGESFHEGDAMRQELILRLLYVAANRREDAVDPIPSLREDEREFFKHMVYGLMVWLDTEERHVASRKAALSLRELRTAENFLANQSTLDVRNLSLCREVLSFGDYKEFSPATFRGGDEVVLYVEIENFASTPVGKKFLTEFQCEYEIFDGDGRRVTFESLPLDKQTCENRRRDYFIAYKIFLPPEVSPGEYSLMLTVEDITGKKSNQATVEFRIR